MLCLDVVSVKCNVFVFDTLLESLKALIHDFAGDNYNITLAGILTAALLIIHVSRAF